MTAYRTHRRTCPVCARRVKLRWCVVLDGWRLAAHGGTTACLGSGRPASWVTP